MQRKFSRIMQNDTSSRLVSMAIMLYSLPRPLVSVEGIVVLPGMGEDWRLTRAIEDWNKQTHVSSFLIPGMYQSEESAFLPTLERLSESPYNLRRTDGVVIRMRAQHTKDQANWIVEQVSELNICSLALYVSPYHLLRSYCTIVKSFETQKVPYIPIIPMPVAVSPSFIIPDTGINAWDMVPGEVARIIEYQSQGDVATIDELAKYLDWLWKQPIVKNASI